MNVLPLPNSLCRVISPAEQLGQFAAEVQTQPGALVPLSAGRIHLREGLEQPGLVFRRMPDPVSVTLNSTSIRPAPAAARHAADTPPRSVNLIALLVRLRQNLAQRAAVRPDGKAWRNDGSLERQALCSRRRAATP